MTYQQEAARKRAALVAARLRHGPYFTYWPGLLDRFRPTVLRGNPIRPGRRVIITNEHFSPANKLVWIMDLDGNEQSVWRTALHQQRRRS